MPSSSSSLWTGPTPHRNIDIAALTLISALVDLQLKRMDVAFRLQQEGFQTATMPENVEQLWGPVPLPSLPEGVPNTCRVATHKSVLYYVTLLNIPTDFCASSL